MVTYLIKTYSFYDWWSLGLVWTLHLKAICQNANLWESIVKLAMLEPCLKQTSYHIVSISIQRITFSKLCQCAVSTFSVHIVKLTILVFVLNSKPWNPRSINSSSVFSGPAWEEWSGSWRSNRIDLNWRQSSRIDGNGNLYCPCNDQNHWADTL